MNLKIVKLQAAVCGVISLLLAAELGCGEFAERQLENSLHYTKSSDEALAELPTIAESKSAADEYGEIVERPLFIQGRKPIVEAEPADKAQNVETSQIDDWLLIGVYNKEKPMALFAKKNETKKYLKIGGEQMISGWLLKEIKSDRVILEQGGQQKSVMLRKPRAESKVPFRGKPAPPKSPAQPTNTTPENATDDSETN